MAQRQFPCGQCGAEVDFQPGSTVLRCPFCGAESPVPEQTTGVGELDFEAELARLAKGVETRDTPTVRCGPCGAETTLPPNLVAAECPFCGSNIVAGAQTSTSIRPNGLLPFKINREESVQAFRAWLKSRWFAPGKLARFALSECRLSGLYVPHWTYDCSTDSSYTGERGDDYWVTEHYTATENGKRVNKTRQVRKTRWRSVRGAVQGEFDDVLVAASSSLPGGVADKLRPWDLEAVVPYADEYLSGFRAERYQVDLKAGFNAARQVIDAEVRSAVCRDIGGDHQRVHSVSTRYHDITFKHLLLPVWLSAYRYHGRVFHFAVNARTGEVQGERPWSVAKIVALVLLLLALAAAVALVIHLNSSR